MTANKGRNLGKCYIFSRTGRVPKDLKTSIDGRIRPNIINEPERWPLTCDFYVQTANLTAKSERAGASMGAANVVLPEGLRYLLDAIDSRVFAGEDVWLFLPGRAGDTL